MWIHLNQSLVGGLLALAGAWLTVSAIRSQISLQKHQEDDRRVRRERAEKALLPHALSDITTYCRACKRYIRARHHAPISQSSKPAEPPHFPRDAVEMISGAIEWASEQDGQRLAQIVSYAQLQRARLEGLLSDQSEGIFKNEGSSPPQLAQRYYEADKLKAHVGRAFDYGRNDDQPVHPMESPEDRLDSLLFELDEDLEFDSLVIKAFKGQEGIGSSRDGPAVPISEGDI